MQGVLREGLGMPGMVCNIGVPDIENPPPDQFSSIAEEALWKESVLNENRRQLQQATPTPFVEPDQHTYSDSQGWGSEPHYVLFSLNDNQPMFSIFEIFSNYDGL